VFGGQARDAHLMLKVLKEQGVEIREVVFGVDCFAFLEQDRMQTPSYRHHPLISGESKAGFLAGCLFAPSLFHCYEKLRESTRNPPRTAFDVDTTGRYRLPAWDAERAEDLSKYVAGKFQYRMTTAADAQWIEQRFEELRSFVEWMDQNGIRRDIFVQPHHKVELAKYSRRSLDAFLARVKGIVGANIPVFAGNGEWADDAEWYDLNHFTPKVADQVLDRVLAASQVGNMGI